MATIFRIFALCLLCFPVISWAAMEPRTNYMINCQGCHLADGRGKTGSVPSMKGELHKFLTVPGGREFLVQVPGSANAPLNDAELAELLNWMLGSMSGAINNNFSPYTEAEVKKLRAKVLVDVMKTRERLVRQFAENK